ncbi:MAG: hypothetical protein FWC22_03770 [Treponema sp.]|nr:hypothetical protein [Treponema sp.]
MRTFLCSYGNFSLAIPMNSVLSIYLSPDKNKNLVNYDSKNRNTYISLPVFFNYKNDNVCHGIILKSNDTCEDSDPEAVEDKIILLSTEIIREKEIPSGNFFPLPKTLSFCSNFSIFKGMLFLSHNNTVKKAAEDLILLLNTEQLVQIICKEKNYD